MHEGRRMMQIVPVSGLGFAPYDVVIGQGLLSTLGSEVRGFGAGPCVVITDDKVGALYGNIAADSLSAVGRPAHVITVPTGEQSKSFARLEAVLDQMLAQGLDRSSLVVALGGGVVGDLGGLAAALFMRGIDFVQVPTTLLAQVDSSVGGKTAIDTPRGKNLIGAFHQPRRVLADIALLTTLPERQLRSGWAEVLKHGLILDAPYFDWLSGPGAVALTGDMTAMAQAVARSVQIKADIVGADEREAGQRALLNLGHTFGHALEAELGFDEDRLTHGEAVALGCCLAFRYSVRRGLCGADEAVRVAATLRSAGLASELGPYGFQPDRLVRWMATDKKNEGGRLTLILARGIGRAFVERDVDTADVLAFLTAECGL